MLQTRRNLFFVIALILVIVLPTALALGWYKISRDPNMRPLAVTREALRDYGVAGIGAESGVGAGIENTRLPPIFKTEDALLAGQACALAELRESVFLEIGRKRRAHRAHVDLRRGVRRTFCG